MQKLITGDTVKTAARLMLGLGAAILLIWTVVSGDGSAILRELRRADKSTLVMAFLIHGSMVFGLGARLLRILKAAGMRIHYGRSLSLTLVGNFFNLALPGSVTGDLVKAVEATEGDKSRRLDALGSVGLDRVFGLYGLAVVAVLGAVLDPGSVGRMLEENPSLGYVFFLMVAVLIGLVLIVLIARFTRFGSLVRQIGDKMEQQESRLKRSFGKLLVDVCALVRRFIAARSAVLMGIAYSTIVHLVYALSVFVAARAVGETEIPLTAYLYITAFANLAAAIPITPGGLGVRDVTIAYLLGLLAVGSGQAAAIPLLLSSMVLFWGALGGGLYLLRARRFATTFSDPDRATLIHRAESIDPPGDGM
jgi:hypothetical protein